MLDMRNHQLAYEGGALGPMAREMLMKSVDLGWQMPTADDFADLSAAKLISLDVESDDPEIKRFGPGFVRNTAQVIGFSVATDTGFCKYFPVRHASCNVAPNVAFSWLKEVMRLPAPKVGANILYDLEGLWFEGLREVNGQIYDVQNAEALLDEENALFPYDPSDPEGTRTRSFSLQALSKKHLGEVKDEKLLKILAGMLKIKDIKGSLRHLPGDVVGPYGEMDAKLPLALIQKQLVLLDKENLGEVWRLECDLIPLLLQMRLRGVPVDVGRAEQVNEELARELVEMKQELQKLAGGIPIDPWDSKSLEKLCEVEKINFPRTAKGNPSFTSPWLEKSQHAALKKVVECRKVEKMRRDFVEGFILNMNVKGRLHPSFHQLRGDEEGTRSGRFSSSNPNCQQLPARDKRFGPMIRGLFIPEHGCKWGCFDYSAQEPRLTVHYAYIAKFQGAAEAVRKYNEDPNTDYHQMVADMAKISRKHAKIINLGLAYGMGKRKLALDLAFITIQQFEDRNFPLPQAVHDLFAEYHKAVPYVKGLADMCMNLAQTRGYIRTILGRRRHFELYEPKRTGGGDFEAFGGARPLEWARAYWQNSQLQRAMTHKALNALIQGSAADMMKKAMIDLWRLGIVPHLTVHDELDDSIDSDQRFHTIQQVMIDAIKMVVPVKVDAELVDSWGMCG